MIGAGSSIRRSWPATCFCAGRIVSTRGREGVEIKTEEASGTAPYPDLPLVVLVNQHTASAAEIVAACLQDHGRAIVVGQRTYGKGTVQNVIRLEGGHSLLKLTTASYWRPSGQDIHRYPDVKDQQHWGVQPNEDYEVALDEAATSELIRRRHQRNIIRTAEEAPSAEAASKESDGSDPQLARAIEALATLLADWQSARQLASTFAGTEPGRPVEWPRFEFHRSRGVIDSAGAL